MDLDRDVPGMGTVRRAMLRSGLEDQEGRARQDLNLILMDEQVGEGAPEFPRGHSQNPPAIRVPVPQLGPELGATLRPHCAPLPQSSQSRWT